MDIKDKYPEAQVNKAGEVALRCVREGRFFITDCPSGKEYVATTQVGICLVWVEPQDVDWIMENKKIGCCGKKQHGFYLADAVHVRRWLNQGGR